MKVGQKPLSEAPSILPKIGVSSTSVDKAQESVAVEVETAGMLHRLSDSLGISSPLVRERNLIGGGGGPYLGNTTYRRKCLKEESGHEVMSVTVTDIGK